MRRALAGGLLLAVGACAGDPSVAPPPRYEPDRRDYAAFEAAWPDLLEPNYLPFMVHRLPADDAEGDVLFFCRWDQDAMPLPVYVAAPEISPEIQDEFAPREPRVYVEAVVRALDAWEGALEGLVTFRRVDAPEQARLSLRLLGEEAPEPEPELQVLGSTSMAGGCRVMRENPDADALDVRFEVSETRLFVADRFGLLSPDQVEWIALHEIGHALGMRGHSPIPADLMYEVVRDRITVTEGLSNEDVNSFVSLYQLPNGTVFGRLPSDHRREDAPSEPGAPKLSIGPYVDSRLGFSLRPPQGWVRVPTAQGMVAVDGVTWDYTASFQIVVHRYPTIESYLERFASYYLSRGRIAPPRSLLVEDRRALRISIQDFEGRFFEDITLIEVGDGRLIVAIGECPPEAAEAYRPWFDAALASLDITEFPERRPHR
jgi:hypothetical protein